MLIVKKYVKNQTAIGIPKLKIKRQGIKEKKLEIKTLKKEQSDL